MNSILSKMKIDIITASDKHLRYVDDISELIESAAKIRGTGIAKRSPEYLETKIHEGKSIIALEGDKLAGFCYIETWGNGKYIANSGLIVHPDYRGHGLATKIKAETFKLSQKKYPGARIFGITTSLAVMKINSSLGYNPVTFSELTTDEQFWNGCQSCVNYDILTRTDRKQCLCTGMLYDPEKAKKTNPEIGAGQSKERWKRFVLFLTKHKDKYINGFKKEKSQVQVTQKS